MNNLKQIPNINCDFKIIAISKKKKTTILTLKPYQEKDDLLFNLPIPEKSFIKLGLKISDDINIIIVKIPDELK